jgi:hypothetical protein
VRQACELRDGRWDSAIYKIAGETKKGEPTENRSVSGRMTMRGRGGEGREHRERKAKALGGET